MRLNIRNGLYLELLALALVMVYIAACATSTGPYQLSRGLRFHVWDMLRHEGDERSGYGMYTYVLFGRRVDTPEGVPSETTQRYKQVVDAITTSTPTAEGTRALKRESNIFYFPTHKEYRARRVTLQAYDSSLAMIYISRLATMIKSDEALVQRLTTRPGPFLVSTHEPLGMVTRGSFPLLYADLSTSNPDAIRETVIAYKRHLNKRIVDKVDRFRSLRLALLNWFLYVDDDLQIVKVTAAQWLPQ